MIKVALALTPQVVIFVTLLLSLSQKSTSNVSFEKKNEDFSFIQIQGVRALCSLVSVVLGL